MSLGQGIMTRNARHEEHTTGWPKRGPPHSTSQLIGRIRAVSGLVHSRFRSEPFPTILPLSGLTKRTCVVMSRVFLRGHLGAAPEPEDVHSCYFEEF